MEKKNKAHIVVALLCILLCAALFAGCAQTANTDAAQTAAPGQTATATPEPSGQTPAGTEDPAAQGNETDVQTEVTLPFDGDALEMMFSSGAGGWATEITLHSDGTFEGNYHDSEMGESDDDYPNGTVYYCTFSGTFADIVQIDDTSYSMKLADITMQDPPGTEDIGEEEGIRYVADEPYGFEDGTEFIFYLSETPIEGFSEEFLLWWPYRFEDEVDRDTLSCYGLRNVKTDYGFFAME